MLSDLLTGILTYKYVDGLSNILSDIYIHYLGFKHIFWQSIWHFSFTYILIFCLGFIFNIYFCIPSDTLPGIFSMISGILSYICSSLCSGIFWHSIWTRPWRKHTPPCCAKIPKDIRYMLCHLALPPFSLLDSRWFKLVLGQATFLNAATMNGSNNTSDCFRILTSESFPRALWDCKAVTS